MYAMLTQVSRDALSYDTFYGRYVNIANELSLENINYEILSSLVNPRSAQVAYNLQLSGVLIKDIQRTTTMKLSLEDGGWRIQWDEALMLPELAGGNKLWMDYKVPARGNIFDREGDVLASQADAVALGIEANKVGPDYMFDILQSAWNALGQRPDLEPNLMLPTLQKYYQNGWYLGLGEVRTNANYRGFTSFDGAVAVEFSGRYYDLGGVAQHAVGYISSIQAEEADKYRRKGYRIEQKVGRAGIELWEKIILPANAVERSMSLTGRQSYHQNCQCGAFCFRFHYTTFLKDYQLKAQRTLNGFRGALVVMERDSGRILAMASSPALIQRI
jgi:penicillin-binding protein 2